MKRIVNAPGNPGWARRACAVLVLYAAVAIALSGQTFTTLFSFNGTDGTSPLGALVQATNGNLYGTTYEGGTSGQGTIFKIAPSGTLTTLYSFCSQGGYMCTDGKDPYAGLVQATNGDLYGTTPYGGAGTNCAGGCGTIFKITPGGTLTTLYNFCSQSGCTDGQNPFAAPVRATNGDLYGTTNGGGANGGGTVFKITASGMLTTLYNFCSQSGCTDGVGPYGALVQATNGDFYGTTNGGGANNNNGTVFKITPSGTLTRLYSFCSQGGCADGESPVAGLVQATNEDLYGTTEFGGVDSSLCLSGSCGTIFKITPSGTLTTLYRLCSETNCTDGETPYAGLVQATDGDLYGTTNGGGANGGGTVFKITPSGTLTTLHRFCQPTCAHGEIPWAALIQATNGDIYGTTEAGGASGHGTMFSLSPDF